MSESDFQESEMSLTDPNIFDKAKARVLSFPVSVRLIGSFIFGLVVIGGVLFGIDKCSNWRTDRAIKKNILAVNAATKEVANAQVVVIQAQANVNAAVEKVKEAANVAILATQASEAGRRDVNIAVQNLANAVAANKPVDINAADLEKRLNDLGVQ